MSCNCDSNRQPSIGGSLRYGSIGVGVVPLVDPPIDDAEAKEVLTLAYQDLFGEEVNLFALGIAQAIGLMEGAAYGKWGPNNASNNWGAITAPGYDKDTDSCPPGTFKHSDSSAEAGQYTTCFRLYSTSLEGATDLLRELYIRRPTVFAAAVEGDIRGVAQEMYATSYYMGVAPHNQKDSNGDFTNVNNYIDFIGRGIDQIADLYPHGDSDSVASGDSNTGLVVGLGLAAVTVLAVVSRS